jgi:hypothetical protein
MSDDDGVVRERVECNSSRSTGAKNWYFEAVVDTDDLDKYIDRLCLSYVAYWMCGDMVHGFVHSHSRVNEWKLRQNVPRSVWTEIVGKLQKHDPYTSRLAADELTEIGERPFKTGHVSTDDRRSTWGFTLQDYTNEDELLVENSIGSFTYVAYYVDGTSLRGFVHRALKMSLLYVSSIFKRADWQRIDGFLCKNDEYRRNKQNQTLVHLGEQGLHTGYNKRKHPNSDSERPIETNDARSHESSNQGVMAANRGRTWKFTLEDYTTEEKKLVDNSIGSFTYVAYYINDVNLCGFVHHGALKMSLSHVLSVFKRAIWERIDGSLDKNEVYRAKKQAQLLTQVGQSLRQGQKTGDNNRKRVEPDPPSPDRHTNSTNDALVDEMQMTIDELRRQLVDHCKLKEIQIADAATIRDLRRQLTAKESGSSVSNYDRAVSNFELCMKYADDDQTKKAILAGFVKRTADIMDAPI